jgi:hypothetical protein
MYFNHCFSVLLHPRACAALLAGSALLGTFTHARAQAEVPQATQAVEAIWHCSKTPVASSASAEPSFSMDATASANGTVSVSLEDLFQVYSGYPVRISGKPLFACFMPGQEALSSNALASMGLNSAALQILSRRSAIVQRNLKIVTDEAEMLRCMAQHMPSFGYLSQAVVNDKVAPCF